MNQYRQYGQMDDKPEMVGDAGFTRLDMLTDPAVLPPGSLAACENMRFDVNGTVVRAGLARQFPVGQTIGLIYGVCVFKPSADTDYLAFATSNYLVLFDLASQQFTYLAYPSGESIGDDAVDMVQAGVGEGTLPQLYILRGQLKTALMYDANTGLVTVASDFAQGDFALFYQDRIAVSQSQQIAVSDFLDFTVFNVLSQFQILKGGSDYIQAFQAYQGDDVLIGTRQGVYLAFFDPTVSTGGYTGALADTSFLRLQTNEAGPVGPRAMLEALGKVWFIAQGAIYAFTPQLDNELVVLGKPLSAGIQPIMQRMCQTYAGRSCIERYGYRLYFGMPISDLPVDVASVTVTPKLTPGVLLPFTLPVSLGANASAQITTAEAHGLSGNDQVQLSGAVSAGLNGEFTVATVIDNFNFVVLLQSATAASAGNRMTSQRLATRNNVVAVYNLNNADWESIDWLPAGLFADWLRPVEIGAARRLMMIDENYGPVLYEEGDADEVGNVTGGITLPFTLPVTLSEANYATSAVAGYFLTRAYRWTNLYTNPFAAVFPRKVTCAEIRATLDPASMVTLNLLARSPNNTVWTGTRDFTASQFETADVPLRKLCGKRALEAQLEIITMGGRPTFRSVEVETVNNGKVPQ